MNTRKVWMDMISNLQEEEKISVSYFLWILFLFAAQHQWIAAM